MKPAVIINQAAEKLKTAGIDSANLDARILLSHASNKTYEQLIIADEVDDAAKNKFSELVARRLNREPVSHIIGKREFFGEEFAVNNHTLDPRPDTETLIEAVLKHYKNLSPPKTILDLGTGTGCIILTLLKHFNMAEGIAVDISDKALMVAAQNGKNLSLQHRVKFLQSNWGNNLTTKFDLVVSNPPYIRTENIEKLEPEVAKYEPELALDGGVDGLKCYREIAENIKNLMQPEALAVFEIGFDQAKQVKEIFASKNFQVLELIKDLSGNDRCVVIKQ